MCNSNSCCKDLNKNSLKKVSLILIGINLVLSIIAIFLRASKTKRYEQALIYLEQRNNGSFNVTLYNCYLDGFWRYDIYCDSDGKRLSKPDENVSHKSVFKKWNKVELILNYSRLFITAIFIVFFYFVLYKKVKDEENNLFSYSIAFLAVLVADSAICILIRSFVIGANKNIGLYEIGNQNEFEEYIAYNYIIDITQIVLNSVVIGFVIRLQMKKPEIIIEPQSQTQTQTQPQPQTNFVSVKISQTQIEKNNNLYTHPLDGYNE